MLHCHSSNQIFVISLKDRCDFRRHFHGLSLFIMQVWEMETGHLVYTLKQAHGSKSAYVSAMVSDDSGQRLITAGQDGKNYNKLWLKLGKCRCFVIYRISKHICKVTHYYLK